MVIVIDLEEEEARKTLNQTSAQSTANGASNQSSSDSKGSMSKSETSSKTEEKNMHQENADEGAAAAASKSENQQAPTSQDSGKSSSDQKNTERISPCPSASKQVGEPVTAAPPTLSETPVAEVTNSETTKPTPGADRVTTTPSKVVPSKSPATPETVTPPSTVVPLKSPATSGADNVTPSVATKSPATPEKITTPSKVVPSKSPATTETVTSPSKTVPSKSPATSGADNVTTPSKVVTSKSPAIPKKVTPPSKTVPSKSTATPGADKVTPPSKTVPSKSTATPGADKVNMTFKTVPSKKPGTKKVTQSKRVSTKSPATSEKVTPPSKIVPAKSSADKCTTSAKVGSSISSASPGIEVLKPPKSIMSHGAEKVAAQATAGPSNSSTTPGADVTTAATVSPVSSSNEVTAARSVSLEESRNFPNQQTTTSTEQDENKLEQDSSIVTNSHEDTTSSDADSSSNNKTETQTSKKDTVADRSPCNSSPVKDMKTCRQLDNSAYSTFSSSFKTPNVHSWVRNVHDRLKKNGQGESALKEFGKCKTDEERISLLYNMPVVHEVLEVKECYQGKNEAYSKDLRMQGNAAFQKKDDDKALDLYSQSIIKAPSDCCTELALTLANRSAVFYHMQKYVLCLQDIRQAFRYGYPDHLQYKLYERRGKASYCLRLKEEANCAFQDAINVLDRAQLDQQKLATLKSDLMKQLQKCSKLVPVLTVKTARDISHNHRPLPGIKEDRNNHVPCMSKSLVVKSSSELGRGIYTTRDFEVGEVMIVEEPYASVTVAAYNYTHCHHCCNRTRYPLPCSQCSGVVFCSEECLDTAWKTYHYAECKYHDLIQKSEVGLGHLALRMVLQAGHKYLRENRKTEEVRPSDPVLLGCNANGIYDSNDYHSVYNLGGHTEDRSSADLFKKALTAVFLLKCIENSAYFDSVREGEDFDIDEEKVFVGGHILRHTQMLPCNAHEVSEFTLKTYRVEMSELGEVGSAIYSTLSLINHSCDPSVVRHSYGNKCVVRAIRNISMGEQIFDNYGVLYPVMSKAMRQEKLQYQYYFTCKCNACMRNWPMYDKILKEQATLQCKKCKTGRIMIPADNRTTRAICADCRQVLDITPDLLHLSRSEEFYKGSLQKVLDGQDMEESLPFLEKHLQLIDRLLVRPWRDYNDCQEAIKQCYSAWGNCSVLEEPDSDDEELMESENRRR